MPDDSSETLGANNLYPVTLYINLFSASLMRHTLLLQGPPPPEPTTCNTRLYLHHLHQHLTTKPCPGRDTLDRIRRLSRVFVAALLLIITSLSPPLLQRPCLMARKQLLFARWVRRISANPLLVELRGWMTILLLCQGVRRTAGKVQLVRKTQIEKRIADNR